METLNFEAKKNLKYRKKSFFYTNMRWYKVTSQRPQGARRAHSNLKDMYLHKCAYVDLKVSMAGFSLI